MLILIIINNHKLLGLSLFTELREVETASAQNLEKAQKGKIHCIYTSKTPATELQTGSLKQALQRKKTTGLLVIRKYSLLDKAEHQVKYIL